MYNSDLITIKNLSKVFIDKGYIKKIFFNANLSIKKNEVIGIAGKNGSGKTTLIKIISGNLLPDQGELYYLGNKLEDGKSPVKRKISFLGDGNRSLYWNLTGKQNIEYFFEINSPHKKLRDSSYQTLINRFDMKHFINQQVITYSKGMKQKLLLIISLIKEPELLIMDEPLNGLDEESIVVIKETIQSLSKNGGMTFLLTSHDKNFLEENCSEIFDIKNYSFISRSYSHSQSEIKVVFRIVKDINFYAQYSILKKAKLYNTFKELYSVDFFLNDYESYKEIVALCEKGNIKIESFIQL
jgi:ABC-2 type transport system ATP-binding protein